MKRKFKWNLLGNKNIISGATASQYGSVFGAAYLSAFVFAPIFGKYGTKDPKVVYYSGAFVQGICALGFGCLHYLNDTAIFISLSYILRFLQIRNILTRPMFVTPIFVAKCLLQICVRHTFDWTLLLSYFLSKNVSLKKHLFLKENIFV